MRAFCILYCILIISPCMWGRPGYQLLIPNGGGVLDPCDRKTIWQGVGHKQAGGSGPRNPFGLDFLDNDKVWNSTLCEMDSDGDGVSNGAELGDPDCVWTIGETPAMNATGHPGICEPWSDPNCLQRNTWYSCESEDLECDAIKGPDVMNMTVRFPETPVPSEETTYICMNFEFPNDTDYHIIADTSAIANNHVVHHMLIHACPSDVKRTELIKQMNTPYICGMQGEYRCGVFIAGWSVGMPGTCHNDFAGFKIGKTGYKYATLQIHWNNPLKVSDYQDSSGMTFYYTPNLRPYNLGNLLIGDTRFSIPPGETSYTVESECSSLCTTRMMSQPVNVTSAFHHMHYLGKEGVTWLLSGDEQSVVMNDPYYSYDNPVIHIFNSPIELKPGDALKMKCTFQSTNKNVTTYQGEATSDEMCYAFLNYYPKEALNGDHCATLNGMQVCSIFSYTDYIDGCQIRTFMEDTSSLSVFSQRIGELCSYTCRKECKGYIKEVRQNPCLQGRVGELILSAIPQITSDFLVKYRSCDVAIFQEENTCQCTTPAITSTTTPTTTPTECATPFTAIAARNRSPLSFVLLAFLIILIM